METQINLEDALTDSPVFREDLKRAEEDVDNLATKLRQLVKACKVSQTAGENFGQKFDILAEHLNEFNEPSNGSASEEYLEHGLHTFSKVLHELQKFRQQMVSQMFALLCNPIEDFLGGEFRHMKDLSKRHYRGVELREAARNKSRKISKGSSKTAEMEEELEAMKKNCRAASLDFVMKINEIKSKRKLELLENVCSFMYTQIAYFHQGYEFCKEIDPFLQNLVTSLHKARLNFEKEKERLEERKKELINLEDKYDVKTPDNEEPEYEGWLFKRTSGRIRDWKKRYFILKDGKLAYYRNPKTRNDQPIAEILLMISTVRRVTDYKTNYCFEIISPQKSYFLQAEDNVQMNRWISIIQETIKRDLSRQSQGSTSSENGVSGEEKSQGKQFAQLVSLYDSSHANRCCADCNATDPEWVSMNLGVIICIKCSGVHRSLGVHLSKVRSLKLDKLDKTTVKILSSLGNEYANTVYEHNMPSSVKKPTVDSEYPERETFIRTKYESKAFLRPESAEKGFNAELIEGIETDNVHRVYALIANGAQINHCDQKSGGIGPLHRAVVKGNLVMVDFLAQNNAKLDIVDEQGWTPLHYAAYHDHSPVAMLLFKRGANPKILDKKGQTPLAVATVNQRADCVTLLRLALLVLQERKDDNDESFREALDSFARDGLKLEI